MLLTLRERLNRALTPVTRGVRDTLSWMVAVLMVIALTTIVGAILRLEEALR